MSTGNLDHWESLAKFHGTGQDDYYDIPALIDGRTTLRPLESEAISLATDGRGVRGLSLAHVQSHIGIDTISLARMGADVTAFDFSPTALERLRDIARQCHVEVDTVVADSQLLSQEEFVPMHGTFDVVYATIGVLSWIADIEAWMRGAAALLRPGGRLALLEIHPLLSMPETIDPLVMDFPYRNDGAHHFEGTGSYANPDAGLRWSVDEHAWSIGEVVMAALTADLQLVHLEEHIAAPSDPRGGMLTREDDGLFRLRIGKGADGRPAEPLPILYTLVAERPAGGTLSSDEPAG